MAGAKADFPDPVLTADAERLPQPGREEDRSREFALGEVALPRETRFNVVDGFEHDFSVAPAGGGGDSVRLTWGTDG